jgi:SRSO17 transposase
MDVKALRQLRPELDLFLQRYAPCFGRDEAGDHAHRFVQGLLLGGDRRSVENIAEAIDGCVVRSLQKFIAQSTWSDDALLDELQGALPRYSRLQRKTGFCNDILFRFPVIKFA